MGLLDGGLQAVFGAAFAGVYLDGTLHRSSRVEAENGNITETFVSQAIKVQKDACTERMRQQEGYSDRDVRLIVLQVAPDSSVLEEPSTDDQITAAGQRWAISGIVSDPANAYWEMRGTPA